MCRAGVSGWQQLWECEWKGVDGLLKKRMRGRMISAIFLYKLDWNWWEDGRWVAISNLLFNNHANECFKNVKFLKPPDHYESQNICLKSMEGGWYVIFLMVHFVFSQLNFIVLFPFLIKYYLILFIIFVFGSVTTKWHTILETNNFISSRHDAGYI